MNLNGISGLNGYLRPAGTETRGRVEQDPSSQVANRVATQTMARPIHEPAPVAERGASLPVEAPAGTDPELWGVLTSEERTFFARVGAMGPLTYGHVMNSARTDTPIMRGGRLDIKA